MKLPDTFEPPANPRRQGVGTAILAFGPMPTETHMAMRIGVLLRHTTG